MLSKYKRIFASFLFLTLLAAGVGQAKAAPQAENLSIATVEESDESSACSNLDVIFIIDQSDSMSRNDSIKNRKFAVEGMIDLLVDLSMNQCPESHHRIGVISFGSANATRVDIELYDIEPNTVADARRIREELRSRLQADNLGTTYPEPAFVEAAKMFARNGSDESEARKRVIIFISDGLPCAVGGQCAGADYTATTASLRSIVNEEFKFSSDLQKREACLAQVRQNNPTATTLPADKITACIENNPVAPASYANSTYLFTLLLHNSDEDYVPSAVSQLEEMSKDYAGYLKKNQRQNQIPSTLREILSQLVGVRPSLLAGPSFAVNPYLNKMIVTAYKQSAEVQFTLSYTDAAGNTHTLQGGRATDGFTLDPDNGYYQFGANETYTILNPYPGVWNMSTSNPAGLDVYYQAIESNFRETAPFSQIPQYAQSPFYNEANPFHLDFSLYDDANNGAVVQQSDKALFAVAVQAKVTAPDSQETTYSLKWNPETKSFRSEQPLQVPLPGSYKISIAGTTLKHEGEPVVDNTNEAQVFNKTFTLFEVDGEFKGLDVTPFKVEAVSPLIGETTRNIHGTLLEGWPLPVLDFPVRVKVTDENGQPFDNPAIFKDAAQAIKAQLTYLPPATANGAPAEAVFSDEITLQPDTAKPGEFTGIFPSFAHEGAYILTLKVDSQNIKDGYWIYQPESKVEFNRTDGLFNRVITYYAILAMVIALILIIIAYNIAIRTNKVLGTLLFMDGSERLAEFGLYNGTNFKVIKPRDLDAYPQLDLKRARVQNIGKKRRGGAQDENYLSSDVHGVRVDCVSSNGRKFYVELYPQTPTVYSEETMAQMVYEPAE